MILRVTTTNDDLSDFDKLFDLHRQAISATEKVVFDLSRCGFLRQNAVAFLGGLQRLIESRGLQAQVNRDTIPADVARNLEKNGFMFNLGGVGLSGTGNTIPYREDIAPNKDALVNYLKMDWLGRGWLQLSDQLRDVIVGRVWEIYENAFEHSESQVGVFSCGQYYPQMRQLKLTAVDFGVGIPTKVRAFLKNATMRAEDTMRWAFQPGTTTTSGTFVRGMGLDFLKQFVRLNRGQLEVFSTDGYAVIGSTHESYITRRSSFAGTLVNISLVCDASYYCLTEEASRGPVF
jgi:signal transduction histidine kinase